MARAGVCRPLLWRPRRSPGRRARGGNDTDSGGPADAEGLPDAIDPAPPSAPATFGFLYAVIARCPGPLAAIDAVTGRLRTKASRWRPIRSADVPCVQRTRPRSPRMGERVGREVADMCEFAEAPTSIDQRFVDGFMVQRTWSKPRPRRTRTRASPLCPRRTSSPCRTSTSRSGSTGRPAPRSRPGSASVLGSRVPSTCASLRPRPRRTGASTLRRFAVCRPVATQAQGRRRSPSGGTGKPVATATSSV